MYPVSLEYREKIQELNRLFSLEIRIEHSQGTLILTDEHIVGGSFKYQEASQAGNEFTVGGVFAGNISFKIVNKELYEHIKFDGARIYPTVILVLDEGIDAHFLQASQPSKMKGFGERVERVPLGVFNIDMANRLRTTIDIKAIDNMILLDKPHSLSKLSYPATLYQIYTNICNVADVSIGTTSITNGALVITDRPTGDLSLRNVLGFVAELSGSFARFNRTGQLELKWYEDSGITINPKNRSNLKVSDEVIQITGVACEGEEKDAEGNKVLYMSGTNDYAINLTDNPLIKTKAQIETVLPKILARIGNTVFNPYTCSWQGNPAMQAGDKITQVDVDGNVYNTLITHIDYKYRGTSKLEAKAKSSIVKGFKSTDNRIARIIQHIQSEFGDKMTTLEEAVFNATNLIQNAMGGYVVKRENELLIMDTKDINTATKVWRWNLNGLGYSNTGYNGIYELAMTMDGSINAKFITTGSISALMVQTGILQSEDGGTTLNLDNGTFNFRDIFKLDNSGATINIGNPATGNYLKLSPGNPLSAYRNNRSVLDIYSDSSGGYMSLGTPTFTERARFQTTDDSYYGHPSLQISSQNTINIMTFNNNDIVMQADRVTVKNEFEVQGAKNARVKTERFGDRLLYSEESDKVYFNTHDIAETTDNKYIIRLDDIFLETIELNSNYKYRIHLTPYADSRIWVKKVYDKYIIIESEIDCEFSYTVRCLRKGYGETYIEERTSDRYGERGI